MTRYTDIIGNIHDNPNLIKYPYGEEFINNNLEVDKYDH